MATSKEVQAVMLQLLTAYDKDLKLEAISLYVDALTDLDADVLREAATLWVRRSEWFPKVAQLRAECDAVKVSRKRKEKDEIVATANLISSTAALLGERDSLIARQYCGEFDAREWNSLIERLRAAGRENAAAWLETRKARIEAETRFEYSLEAVG
jgi:hypothetical protein